MLSERQETILQIVKEHSPITGQHIANQLHVTRAALRSDLAILTMLGLVDARPKLGYFFTGNKEKDLLSRAITDISIESCLSQPVIVGEHTSAYDSIIAMFTEDVGTVFVGTDNILAGVVSRKDLLKTAMGNNDLRALPVRMVMTPVSKLIYVEPNEKALVAAQRMIEYEVDCLPVVNVLSTEKEEKKDLQIVGRISKTNITRLFVECGLGRRN
ncbi:transcriptional regulator [Megasphaera cerevisiae DSM 20462]|jgi:CBS domain-containing protein|uniref:Transcriptional regulator n=1 Tax=Megasphaera cerevisiae DSM 20462 TaxID=1122219 RepID=A0A0J6WX93_9FIRM|nr:helix-turn-helix transcriptional regulator [Megasphaera cerevisiae]KMO86462.1 transcriptional regulator [Megasphaera cerevisiae DSM 20462]OKY53385.1 transcriptional regulator [Megasphaera cerevisiae]SJZ94799.1 CBS domain-containing protein [Megasphaera cerevisiae DSM 20462]